MTEGEGEGYEVSMPFVCVESVGGPYEDEAFVAGFQVGSITAALGSGVTQYLDATVRTGVVDQLDLAAMKHGFLMTREAWSEAPEEWTFVKFVKGSRS